jgi:hypothetical protein
MRASRAEITLSKQFRYSLQDTNGYETNKVVMSEAEYIAYALQTGRRPETYMEYPCSKCEEYCIDKSLCAKGKTTCSMTDGSYGTIITKTGYDFANFLLSNGLVSYEAVQRQIDLEKDEYEKAAQAAELKQEASKKAAEIEAQAEAVYKKWLNETTKNYGAESVSENVNIQTQKEIFQHVAGGYDPRVISFLVQIDNIDNPRCRRDIISRLHNHNTASIKTFEHITGTKLAKTEKERKAQLQIISKADYGEPKQFKPRKEAVKADYDNVFYLLNRADNGTKFVESRGRLWRYKDYMFFIQKNDKGGYKATEGKTGLLVANDCKTLTNLKKKIIGMVNGSIFADSIERSIGETGLSPLYTMNGTV